MLSSPPKDGPDGRLQLHASTVVIDGAAVAITGLAGSGKSGLALSLMSLGAGLLADDITWLHKDGQQIIATCPQSLSGQIEARGVGILNAPAAGPAPLSLVIDLGTPEQDRIPPHRTVGLFGRQVPLLHNPATSYFAPMILHYMKGGRSD